MADVQLIKYTGENHGANYELKKFAQEVKTAKTYTELEQKLTINYFSKLDVYDSKYAEAFSFMKRGYLQRALGQGIRYIEHYGTLQTREFKPAKPGDKLCLEVPNNITERSETIGKIARLYCSGREPDIMDAYELYVDPVEMDTFKRNKVGSIVESVALYINLLCSYVLGIDPWGDEHADYFNNYTIRNILAAKWDDTAIANFGDEQQGIGACLNYLKEALKDEIDKEKNLKNVNVYPVWKWLPSTAAKADKQKGTKAKKPTAAIDDAKLKKMYFDNKEVDPSITAAAICKCLLYHCEMMTNEITAQNDSMFTGNLTAEERAKYGKEAGADKTLFLPISVPKEELIIIMNSELYKELLAASVTSPYVEAGAYGQFIKQFMGYSVIAIDTMPYGAFKIGSKYRYNLWDLYDKVETDTLGQMDYKQYTAHKGIAFGIRTFRPFKYIRLTGVYMNPTVEENMMKIEDAVELA